MKTAVPDNVVAAVNSLLEPYGEHYTPALGFTSNGGYLCTKDAIKYLGVSKSFFWRLVSEGKLETIKLTDYRNGKSIVMRSALDEYVQAHANRKPRKETTDNAESN